MTYSDRLRKEDWEVRSIPLKQAKKFIEEHHYARGSSNTAVYAHGLFRKGGDTLFGVVIWLPPTRVACESVNKAEWKRVLSLTRMAVAPGVPKNACSFLLARSVRIIEKEKRFVSLVTYADESQDHEGRVYRAANWQYVGKMKGSPRWVDPATGRQVAKKSTVSRTDAQMRALGYEMTGVFAKHKYVKHLHQDGRDLV